MPKVQMKQQISAAHEITQQSHMLQPYFKQEKTQQQAVLCI
jgi:hypothetical protein